MTRLMLDSNKLRVRVCCGMHCAGDGGGKPLIRALEEALNDAGVFDKVDIWPAHCLGECQDGPCVRVGQDRFYRMAPQDMPALVRDEILPRL